MRTLSPRITLTLLLAFLLMNLSAQDIPTSPDILRVTASLTPTYTATEGRQIPETIAQVLPKRDKCLL